MANPSGRGGFAPGRSGNPRGRPLRGRALAEHLRRELDRPHKRGQTNQERIVEVVVKMAVDGNLQALAWIADRTEGKVADRLKGDLSVNGGVHVYLPERREGPPK